MWLFTVYGQHPAGAVQQQTISACPWTDPGQQLAVLAQLPANAGQRLRIATQQLRSDGQHLQISAQEWSDAVWK